MPRSKDPRNWDSKAGFTLANCRAMFGHYYKPYFLGCQKDFKKQRYEVILRVPIHKDPVSQEYLENKLKARVNDFVAEFGADNFKFFYHES